AGSDEAQTYPGAVSPGVEHLAFELWAVIDGDRQWQSAQICEPLEHGDHSLAGDRGVDFERQALATVVIDDRKDPHASAVAQSIAHEVHRPATVHGRGLRQWLALEEPDALAFSPANRESRVAVQSVGPLAVHGPAFSSQQHVDTSIPVAALLARE